MEKQGLEIGGVVVFIDSHRAECNALVTAIHGDPLGRVVSQEEGPDGEREYGPVGESWPCINLLIVSSTPECQDQYGRQLERHASVVHMEDNSTHGFCFRFPDEKIDPALRQSTVS